MSDLRLHNDGQDFMCMDCGITVPRTRDNPYPEHTCQTHYAASATGILLLGAAYIALIQWRPDIAFWIFAAGLVAILWLGLYVILVDL